MKNYKLRIYKLKGINKGNLDHEEFFGTMEELNARYKELFNHDNYSYNPTAWELQNNEYHRIMGY